MATSSSTSSSSVTSTLISSLNGGSGINMTGLAEQLATAQFAARIDQLNSKNDKLTTQISAASTLKGMIATLASSMGDRVRTGDLAVTPLIANSAVATVSKGSATGSGTSSLEVTAIAKGQTITSPVLASATTTTGSGSLTLRFGTITPATGNTPATFTADAARAQVDITIAPGTTLDGVAAAINAKNAGVTAYVATGSTGAQLVIKGADGAANAFQLEAAEDPADPGLAQIAWTPAEPARLKSSASDAAYILDGVPRTSTTNTITDAAPGISLKLTGTNTGNPTTISFSDPSSAITTAMDDLTSALNQMVTELNGDTAQGAALNNNPGARALRKALTSLSGTVIMPGAASGAPSTLADLGLKTNRDGTFTLDTAKLAATLASSPSGTAAMFTNGLYGVYATFDKISRAVSSTADANALGGAITSMTSQQAAITKQLSLIADKQETLRTSLVGRFAKLDTRLSDSKSTLSFLTAQVAAWNKPNN